MTIEDTHAQLEAAIHDYARAAVAIERDSAAWDSDVEPFKNVRAAVRIHGLAVLEEAVASANFIAGEGAIMDGHTLRARIVTLGGAP